MSSQERKEGMTLTFAEAVETLSTIADLQFDQSIGSISPDDRLLQEKFLANRDVHWLQQKSSVAAFSGIKEAFRVILKHLQNFYKDINVHASDFQALEEIKTIMVVVGEAAKKLDRYTTLFYKARDHSVTNLKEYKQLQEFYLSRIAKKIDEGTIGKWILALAQKGAYSKNLQLRGQQQSSHSKHVFIDLESVKKDSEYELFFLKKEDGTRFFSPRLIKNIKLVSDFGSIIEEGQEESFLFNPEEWQDNNACHAAKNIVRSAKKHIEKFYREAGGFKDSELVELVNKTLIALMMAANPTRLTGHGHSEIKSCRCYFYDFQLFLRESLNSGHYQKLLAYPAGRSNALAHSTLSLVHFLCMVLYTQLVVSHNSLNIIHHLIQKASDQLSAGHQELLRNPYQLWSKLAGDYIALSKLLKGHVGGPLNKVLLALENGECHRYDPMIQENLPSHLYTLYVQENKFQFARWPSPTSQEFIQQAKVNEEFKAFLYGCGHEWRFGKILLFNFQDKLSWKEQSRSLAIEDIPNHESFTKQIEVVTLEKDTEFYHQLAPYNLDNEAEVFKAHFKARLSDGNSGFYLPKPFKKELVGNFIPGVLEAIHRIFFFKKDILSKEERLNFIDIFYLFLELKIIECLKPDQIGFSCKDGLDVSSSAGVELFAFLKLLNQERLSENDQEHLDAMLYAPLLILRERVMMADRFNRMLNALKTVELVKKQFGQSGFTKILDEAFGLFYKTPILRGKLIVPN